MELTHLQAGSTYYATVPHEDVVALYTTSPIRRDTDLKGHVAYTVATEPASSILATTGVLCLRLTGKHTVDAATIAAWNDLIESGNVDEVVTQASALGVVRIIHPRSLAERD